MSVASTDIQNLAVDTIRTLSMDAVQTANSGHPGTPMALAPIAYQLFNRTMNYDPAQPNWPGRDRFVLSCGHASMLLYSVLHLAGVKAVDDAGKPTDELAIPLEDIKNFRQIGSVCAGHPEYGEAAGIETTTGPLGAGVSNSVGMAMAQKWLAANYNTPDHNLFDYNVYAVCSDGDLMEGVACEAASVAGHLKLNNLCWIYDDNHITIEGDTELSFSEDVGERFQGLGWNVLHVADANDLAALGKAIEGFQACDDQAHDHHRPQHHRLRCTQQAKHSRGTRRAAGLGRGRLGQGKLWFPRRRKVLHPRRSHRTLSIRHRYTWR